MFIDDLQNEYTIGDFVFTNDGRSGRITGTVFDDEGDITFYRLDTTLFQLWTGRELSVFAPGEESPFVSAPLPPELVVPDLITGAFLTQAIFALRQDLLARIDAVQGVDRQTVAAMIADGVVTFTEPIAVALDDLRSEQVALHAAQGALFEKLESLITTGLSEIGTRLDALDAQAQESAGLSLFDLLGQVGNLVKDPLAFVLEKSTDFIVSEVVDGLNR